MIFNPKININLFLKANTYIGHEKNLCDPSMIKYLRHVKKDSYIIDPEITNKQINTTLKVIYLSSLRRKKILFVDTRKETSDIVKASAQKCGQFYIDKRWLGGMLTNWSATSSLLKNFNDHKRILLRNKTYYTKKELLKLNKKYTKLEQVIGGIKDINTIPDILFVADVKNHITAIKEAKKLQITIVGIVDSNSSPKDIDFIIPGNDDSRKSISFYCNLISQTIIFARKKVIKNIINSI